MRGNQCSAVCVRWTIFFFFATTRVWRSVRASGGKLALMFLRPWAGFDIHSSMVSRYICIVGSRCITLHIILGSDGVERVTLEITTNTFCTPHKRHPIPDSLAQSSYYRSSEVEIVPFPSAASCMSPEDSTELTAEKSLHVHSLIQTVRIHTYIHTKQTLPLCMGRPESRLRTFTPIYDSRYSGVK